MITDNKKKAFTNSFTVDNEYNMLMSALSVSVSKHLLDEHFTVVWANDYYYKIIGYQKEEYERIFHNQCDIFFQDNRKDWDALVKKVREAIGNHQSSYECITRMRNKGGNMMWIKVVGIFTEEAIEGIPVVYTVMTDISDLIQTRLEQTVTYDNIPGFIAKFKVKKDQVEFLDANDKFNQFFGEDAKKQFQHSLVNWETEKNKTVIAENYEMMCKGKPLHFVVQVKDKNDQKAWLQLNAECIDWINHEPIYLIVYIDITDLTNQRELQKKTNDQLSKLAFVDKVTGGFNRTRFEIEAGREISSMPSNSFVLVSLDIQKFKLVNDLFGIEAGDQTLKYIHDVIKKDLDQKEYVARLAGDNFILLLKYSTKQQIQNRLEEMARLINQFNQDLERKYILSLTAGIYPIDNSQLPITSILDRANVARKNSRKSLGGRLCSCIFYSDLDRIKMMKEKEIENRMRDALNQEEFIVYLQPKVLLKNKRIAGAEALVRWLDPENGLIPPNDFIPFFEKNKFIIELDLYVFERVCRIIRNWIDQGLDPIPISVNMSRAHFIEQDFLKKYEMIREKYDIPAEFIEIELTETLIFENPKVLLQVINQIHQKGFQCSLDDFGSGYSSLNILKDLNFDTMKLDKAFFRSKDASNQREKEVIISVVELAKKLNMTTVAEGVETLEQTEFLYNTKCDFVQGYVFSRPVPVKEFENMVYGKSIRDLEQ